MEATAGPRWGEALVFVADLDEPTLGPDDDHHLRRVLRLRSGAAVGASDGAGRWRPCRLDGEGRLEAQGAIEVVARPEPAVGVGFAPPKGDRPELAVQKLTELGVDRIVVFEADRSVVRWRGERLERQLGRLRRVARAACAQSRRCRWPDIRAVGAVDELLGSPSVAVGDVDGGPPTLERPLVLVGPEGGWSDRERALVGATVGLAPNILRVETAAMAAGAVLVGLRDGRLSSVAG